jgi:hypothetical protein
LDDGLEIIFQRFHKRTGIYIDYYGDTVLSLKNIKLLMELIDQYVQGVDININKKLTSAVLEFKGVLKYLLQKNISVKLLGD